MSRPDFPADFLANLTAAVNDRDGYKDHGEIRFRCPDHTPDEHPSARWNATAAVWVCDVCKKGGGALGLADRLGIPRPEPPETITQHGRPKAIVAKYDYHDRAGK